MKVTWVLGAAGVTTCLLALTSFTAPTSAYVTSFPEEPDIDGVLLTVGIAVAKFFAMLIPYPTVSALILAIINAWEPKPEDDYWENVKENVEQVCGDFINEQNLQQVEVYKKDLITLLEMYDQAGVVSDGTYPSKNVWADAITTSIISNRYLVEAALMPWSMAIDFVDIAGVHLLVLKDAAELYTSAGGEVSRWWVDLSRELQHYIDYGIWLEQETVTWRRTQIECYFDEASVFEDHDTYRITDYVRDYTETCVQLHPDNPEDGSCRSFCDLYQAQVDQDTAAWLYLNVESVVDEWSKLKLQADAMVEHVSQYYDPLTQDQ